ncbi:MAG: hypothetical protein ACRCZA_09240 [Shewanella sp.]|uniref:hypothetical protein n=1 Tax=Shewanella sp. TaxID=50422 RepID=UPI003F404788
MRIPATRSGSVNEAQTQTQPTLQGRSGKEKQPKSVGAKNSAPRSPDINRLDRWSLIGGAQQKIADAQGSERALSQVMMELRRLDQQLSRQKVNGDEIANRLKQLEAHVTTPKGPLTAALKPRMLLAPNAQRFSYGSDQLDLVSPKNSAERLVMAFPSAGSAQEINLPANAKPMDAVKTIDQSLRKEKIQARLNELGKLELSVAEAHKRKLDEPVLVSGQGIRVPAGNPVPVQFKQTPGQLSQLGNGISAGDIVQERQRLQKVMMEIERSIRELKAFRLESAKQLAQVRVRTGSASAQQMGQLQDRLSSQLGDHGFTSSMTSLAAQANVSRQNVVALLS